MAVNNLKKYLFWFANELIEFRLAEMESLASLFKTRINWIDRPSNQPYCIVELPSDETVRQIAHRSVTLRHVTELYVTSTRGIQDLHDKLKNCFDDVVTDCNLNSTFKINVEMYGKHQSTKEKIQRIDSFEYLPLKGKVNLNDPEVTFQCIEYYGMNSNNIPEIPVNVFFGKLIAKSKRHVITDLSLKKRKFIGNTSMASELSLIMANQAKIKEGDLVLDPFVGTGSLLVAAAFHGAYVFGVDIDFLMLHGKTKQTRKQTRELARKGESVLANMRQYGLDSRYLDVFVGDSSLPIWRSDLEIDAIITDPPYGLRASNRKVGTYDTVKEDAIVPPGKVHYPKKVIYHFDHIMFDLLNIAARHLKIGGRLVTWIPIFRNDYDENSYIPRHPCFSLIWNSEQVITTVMSRRLLTFEKIKQPQEQDYEISKPLETNFREKFLGYYYDRTKCTNGEFPEEISQNV